MSPYPQPLINVVPYVEQSLQSFLDPCFNWFNKRGIPHRLCLNNLVIQVCLNIINQSQYGNASVPIEDGVEQDGAPLVLHCLHSLQTELFACTSADGFKVLQKGLQVVLEHLAEEGPRVWGDGEAKDISHIVLVALSKAWSCKECG